MTRILRYVLIATVGISALAYGSVNAEATHQTDPYTVRGWATHYECTAGWCDGTPTVALPLALGGRYTGRAHGIVTVCATRCADLLVVDYCQCYWGTNDQRIVDLNDAAWRLITDLPPGKIKVTLYSGIVKPHFERNLEPKVPDTSMKNP